MHFFKFFSCFLKLICTRVLVGGEKKMDLKQGYRKNLEDKVREVILAELRRRDDLRKQFDWHRQARLKQKVPEGNWRVWMIMAGRGFGKTRTGAETIRRWVLENRYKRIGLVGNSESETRDIMVEGVSGLLNVHHPDERPNYEPSKRRITWKNGATATLLSAENVEQFRGPQFDALWIDEFAKFRNARDVWDQANFCLRLGQDPRMVITTTPRATEMIRTILEAHRDWAFVTRGSTFDNGDNLSKDFLDQVTRRYAGTKIGEQELYGRVLSQLEGALWSHEMIARSHVQEHPPLRRIVVAVDPAATSHAKSDETGIIVAGICANNEVYILKDLSGKYTPNQWAQKAVEAYTSYKAAVIVAEVNQGGDLVTNVIRTCNPSVHVKTVHATQGKAIRAEPVVALYEQGRVKHLPGLEVLETQLSEYVPGESSKSPDRMDALVWGVTELAIVPPPNSYRFWMSRQGA